jgi:hypothetical protein
MHYSYEVNVLTSHTSSSPLVYPIKLASGILNGAEFLFEVGDGFSSCVTLWDRGKQLLPSNPDGFYTADGISLKAPVWYDLDFEDNDLFIVAWNRGGIYDHPVNVMLSVKGNNEPDPFSIMQLMNETIGRLIQLCRELI